MTLPTQPLREAPDPLRFEWASARHAFGLWGGPVAWFIQLCAGYGLASWPCFPNDHRLVAPRISWSMDLMDALLIVGVLIALAAAYVSSQTLVAARAEMRAVAGTGASAAAGRKCFLALWGIVWGVGFAVATAFTAVAFIALPRCGG